VRTGGEQLHELHLKYNKPVTETISVRSSVRTYANKSLKDKDKKEIANALQNFPRGDYRFALTDLAGTSAIARKLGTYGVIKGAQNYLVGIMRGKKRKDKTTALHFGFDFEQVILKATELGLGTCWLGGTFNPLSFSGKLNLRKGERIVMVSPLGYPAGAESIYSRAASAVTRSRQRKHWDELFFYGLPGVPLARETAKAYEKALEMVRLAPSAVNTQPWRVILINGSFHFFAAETRYYNLVRNDFFLFNDLGIAMSHFTLSCRVLGLKGKWLMISPGLPPKSGLSYIRTWQPASGYNNQKLVRSG